MYTRFHFVYGRVVFVQSSICNEPLGNSRSFSVPALFFLRVPEKNERLLNEMFILLLASEPSGDRKSVGIIVDFVDGSLSRLHPSPTWSKALHHCRKSHALHHRRHPKSVTKGDFRDLPSASWGCCDKTLYVFVLLVNPLIYLAPHHHDIPMVFFQWTGKPSLLISKRKRDLFISFPRCRLWMK